MKEDLNKYITDISVDELSHTNVVACTNNEGYSTILVRNSGNDMNCLSFENDFFCMKNNVQLSIDTNNIGLFHILICKKTDEENIVHFKRVGNYLFLKPNKALSSDEMLKLFNSLETIFNSSTVRDVASEIGLYGELALLNYVHDLDSNIYLQWHNNFLNKYDMEINDKVKIEIKTTVKDFRKHTFSHDQIYRPHLKVYIVSLLLKPVEVGMSLYDLCLDTMKLLNNEQIINLEKQMKKLGINEHYNGINCILTEVYDQIKFYNAEDLPKIDNIPDGISNVHYDVDLSNIKDISIKSINGG